MQSRRSKRKADRAYKKEARRFYFTKNQSNGGKADQGKATAGNKKGGQPAKKTVIANEELPAKKKRRRRRDDDEDITSEEEDGPPGPKKGNDTEEDEEDEEEDVQGEEGEEEEGEMEDAGGEEAAAEDVEAPTGSYVPPHLRGAAGKKNAAGVDQAAQRQLRSVMNRVTEGNLDPSARELAAVLDKLVPEAGSKVTADALLKVLLPAAVGDPNISVLVLGCHAALATASHLLFGIAFGAAALLQAGDWLSRRLSLAEADGDNTGEDARVARSCVTFLCLLFSFGLLPGSVVYDLLRFIFADDQVSEIRVELSLTVLRYAGKTLRADCPEDFRAALAFVGTAAAGAQAGKAEGSEIRTRLDYLLKELQDLKNNKVSFAVMDRFDAIRSWIKTAPMLGGKKVVDHRLTVPFKYLGDQPPADWPLANNAGKAARLPGAASKSDPLREMAVAQRLSTELRQSLFVALMGAEDCDHAVQRLSGVAAGAKAGVEEACLVILHCVVREKTPNPFYEHVAISLCARPAPWGKKFSYGMKRAFIQHMQQVHGYGVRATVNLAEMAAGMVLDSSVALPLSIVRFVRFGEVASMGSGGGKSLGGVLGLLMRHTVETLLRRLPDVETTTQAFTTLLKYEDVRDGMMLVLDNHVQSRLPPQAEDPEIWKRLKAARKALTASHI